MRVLGAHSSHGFYTVSVLVLAVLMLVYSFGLYFHDYMSLDYLHALSVGYWIAIAYTILFSEVSVKGFVPFHN